eukprot:SAG25_NODE_2499_length_1567_cov_4.892371_1_plen_446_part_01
MQIVPGTESFAPGCSKGRRAGVESPRCRGGPLVVPQGGGGAARLGAFCAGCGRVCGKKSFTVTVDQLAKELQMHASAQPAPPVRRIDLIKICLLCYRTRCMECGPGGVDLARPCCRIRGIFYMYFTTLRAAVYESAANAEQPSRPRMMSRSRAQPLLLLLLHGLLASAHESGDGGVGGRVATAATGVLQPAEKGMVSPRRRELRTGSSVVAQGGNLHAMQAAGCRDDPTGYLARMRAWYGATDTCSNMVQRTGCAHAWGGGNHLVADHCPFSCFGCSSQKYDALNRLFLHVAIPVGDIDGVYDSGAVRVDLKKLVCKDLSVGSLHLAGSGPTAGHNPQEVRARLQARDVMITCSTTVVWRLGSIVEDETTGEVSTATTSIDGTVVFQSPNFATTPPRTATVVCDSNSIVLGQLTGPDLSGSSFTTRVANLGLSIGWLEQKVQNKLS